MARLQRSLARQFRQYAAMRSDIGLVMTEQCPVGCRHCLASCTMEASDLPPLATHLAWVAQVARVDRCKALTITGGEPFVYYQRLLEIVHGCRAHGLRASVFTSAYWATRDEIADLKLQQLAEAGLTGITVSSDEYHQERIPLTNVVRVLRASQDRGIAPKISLTCAPHGPGGDQLESDLRRRLGRHALDGVEIEAGGIVKAGRACELAFFASQPAERSKLVCNALGPVIGGDGTVAACCRAPLPGDSPLILGDLDTEEFESIYRRFLEHPIIPFIQTWGLIEMLERLLDEGLASGLVDYRDATEEQICELCQAILADQAHVSFFTDLLHDPEVRGRLGILTFVLYGDPALLETMG
jgi:hypothetical protein